MSSPATQLLSEILELEWAGNISLALQKAQDALQSAQASGDSEWLATALSCMARLQFWLGRYDRAARATRFVQRASKLIGAKFFISFAYFW